MSLSSAIFFGASLFFAPSLSFAVITLQSISGASRIDTTTTATSSKPIVYAGFAGTCTLTSNSVPCDSCDGTGLKPCNKTNAVPSLRLTVRLDMGRSDLTYDRIKARLGSTNEITMSVQPVVSGSAVDITLLWSEICAADPAGGNSASCPKSIANTTLYLGYQATGETTATYYEIQLMSRVVDPLTATTFQLCDAATDPNANQGFCNYALKPGDSKAYMDDSKTFVASGFPSTEASGVKYQDVLFFYKANDGGQPTRAATLGSITNQSEMTALTVTTSENPPVSDNRIDGLTNGVEYCFIMANRDVTGIISYYAPYGSMPDAELCVTPEEVYGLLDDKKCFIATAAFGSEMAPEVQSFRDFRNRYLLTNSFGKSFVKFYYAHSPKYAKIIAQHDGLRVMARLTLWPMLGFAKLTVALGFWATMALILSLGIVGYYGTRRFRKVQA